MASLTADLEFLQLLANPEYLHILAVQGYFDDAAFLSYLSYLRQSFHDRRLAVYVEWPMAFLVLEKLKDSQFRKELREPAFYQYIHTQQVLFWQKKDVSSES